jgi:hypothetical protein
MGREALAQVSLGQTVMKHSEFARDFSSSVRRALLKRGIVVLGICAIPDMSHPMPFANASRGYQLSDNGTGKVRSHIEVIAMSGVSK